MRLPPGAVAAGGGGAMPVTWVHLHAKCSGAAVSTDAIEQAGGWRFVDHGDGFGLVYWFPPEGAPERDRLLRDSIVGLPVQRLGTAGAPTLDDDDDASVITTAPPPGVFTDAVVTELGAAPRARRRGARRPGRRRATDARARSRPVARARRRPPSSPASRSSVSARDVGAGGDCFFDAPRSRRARTTRGCMRARWRTVQHMRTHRAEFEPFIPVEQLAPTSAHGRAGRGSEADRDPRGRVRVEPEYPHLGATSARPDGPLPGPKRAGVRGCRRRTRAGRRAAVGAHGDTVGGRRRRRTRKGSSRKASGDDRRGVAGARGGCHRPQLPTLAPLWRYPRREQLLGKAAPDDGAFQWPPQVHIASS